MSDIGPALDIGVEDHPRRLTLVVNTRTRRQPKAGEGLSAMEHENYKRRDRHSWIQDLGKSAEQHCCYLSEPKCHEGQAESVG